MYSPSSVLFQPALQDRPAQFAEGPVLPLRPGPTAGRRACSMRPKPPPAGRTITRDMYELFEHTADLGLRAVAADLDSLFAEAARGLFSIIVENLDQVEPGCKVSFHIEGSDPAYLLFDWLNELLVTFDTRHLLFAEFDVHVTDQGVQATAGGEQLDTNRHHLDHEIKAITYHGLSVVRIDNGWQAEVIVDI